MVNTKKPKKTLRGAYGGLGIVITHESSGSFSIRKVTADRPPNAGLLQGDRVIAIDNALWLS